VNASLAVTGGVHTPLDAVKAVMCGAHAVQLVSALLRGGPRQVQGIRDGVATWLQDHEYDSLAQMRGSMNLDRCPNPRAYGRVQYLEMLQTWEG
jgi:dihydroorotate dehydrogenase (fumarate)